MDELRLRRLLDVGRSLLAELDPEAVLDRLLEVAQELTTARYAAIGVLDERRELLEQFITKGIDEETHRAIGDLPHGRGVLGVLIRDPKPLRLADVGTHPESYGFPLAHPPMHTFLGVPIVVHGEVWGNLYLTEKQGGEFTEDDEEAVTVLADWAAIAIANARLYRDVRQRRDELLRANRGLETTTEIGRALGGVTDLDRVLELIVKRSRALIEARGTQLALLDGDELVVAAVAGQGMDDLRGTRLPVEHSIAGAALRTGKSQRFSDVPDDTFAKQAAGARTALVTPMMFRNRSIGFLSAFDRMSGGGAFTEEDERLLQAFAASAATAVATAQSATNEALQRSVQASEHERRRWARELHDETLQELAGLKVLLSSARRDEDRSRLDAAVDGAVELLGHSIANLRALITDLRPASLDELGTQPALEALVDRVRAQSGLDVTLDVRLAYEEGRSARRHAPELEVAIYRLVQEALTNVVKHADATQVAVVVVDPEYDDGQLVIEIRDDGQGFDPDDADAGFGLLGMRERVALVRGELEVRSAPGEGTTVVARIPVERTPEPSRAPLSQTG
jgi:signal transduction histidine kinase